jgi:TolB-like protein
VLPLENVSKDPAQEYFADGMTEALIGDLARIKALRVISRTSAMKYKGAQKSLPEIARELDVDAILEGSALLVGNRVRIRVQLVVRERGRDAVVRPLRPGAVRRAGLQSEVAETVAKEIALQLTPTETAQLAQRPAVNAKAHVEYLKALHLIHDASPQAIALALKHLDQVLALDPGFAPAWAALADVHLVRAGRGMAPPAEADAAAQAAAERRSRSTRTSRTGTPRSRSFTSIAANLRRQSTNSSGRSSSTRGAPRPSCGSAARTTASSATPRRRPRCSRRCRSTRAR